MCPSAKRLRTNSSKLTYDGQDLEIKAGMTVTVEVISGEKTVFDYLMKPILKSRQRGKAGARTHGGPPAVNATGSAPTGSRTAAGQSASGGSS